MPPPKTTEADVLGFFALAMSAPVGLRLQSLDVEFDLRLLYRVKQKKGPDLPIAFLPRDNEIWIVKKKFMKGKTFDAEAARNGLEENARDAGSRCDPATEGDVPADE